MQTGSCWLRRIFSEGSYVFSHDRIRESALSFFSKTELEKTHAQLADFLQNSDNLSYEQEFALAFHYLHGGARVKNEKAFAACLKAGQFSLHDYSYRQASVFLAYAVDLIEDLEISSSQASLAWEKYGLACLNSGQIELAHKAFDQCLPSAKDKMDRARIILYKMKSHSSQGDMREAWQMFLKAIKEVGRAYPKSKVGFAISFQNQMYLLIFHLLLPRSLSKQKKMRNERRYSETLLISEIYEMALQVSYNLNRVPDTVYLTMTGFNRVFRLGASSELGQFIVRVGSVLANFGMKRVTYSLMGWAEDIAKEINDPTLGAYVSLFTLPTYSFLGDWEKFDRSLNKTLDLINKYLSTWYLSQYYFMVIAFLNHRGYSQELVTYFMRIFNKLDSTQEYGQMSMLRYMVSAHMWQIGRQSEAEALIEAGDEYLKKVPSNVNSLAIRILTQLTLSLERGDIFAESIEKDISEFFSHSISGFYWNIAFIVNQYLRLEQVQNAQSFEDRQRYLDHLWKSHQDLKLRALSPTHKCHVQIGKAALARLAGDFSLAKSNLLEAEELCKRGDSILGQYWCALEKARIELDRGYGERAKVEAKLALDIAKKENWKLRVDKVSKEFGIDLDQSKEAIEEKKKKGLVGKTEVSFDFNTKKAMDVLLQVSIAASESVDVKIQSMKMLKALIHLMGAERAYIFVIENDHPVFYAGQDSNGVEILEPKGYSSTVIQKVFESGESLIFTGSDSLNKPLAKLLST